MAHSSSPPLSLALVAALGVTLTCLTARADAPDESNMRLPVPEAERPLTLPRFVASPVVGFQFDRSPGGLTYGELDVSGRFGITDDLGVHALVAPLQLSSPPGRGGLQYGQTDRNLGPGVGVTYRFVRGPVELGAEMTGYVSTIPGISGGSLTPELLLRIHPTWALRVDVDPFVTFESDTVTSAVHVHVPVALRANVTREFDVGMTTGVSTYDVSDARRSTGIPLGFLLGYALPGKDGPVADIDPFFTFPYLVLPGRASPMNSGQYEVGLTVSGFLYL